MHLKKIKRRNIERPTKRLSRISWCFYFGPKTKKNVFSQEWKPVKSKAFQLSKNRKIYDRATYQQHSNKLQNKTFALGCTMIKKQVQLSKPFSETQLLNFLLSYMTANDFFCNPETKVDKIVISFVRQLWILKFDLIWAHLSWGQPKTKWMPPSNFTSQVTHTTLAHDTPAVFSFGDFISPDLDLDLSLA